MSGRVKLITKMFRMVFEERFEEILFYDDLKIHNYRDKIYRELYYNTFLGKGKYSNNQIIWGMAFKNFMVIDTILLGFIGFDNDREAYKRYYDVLVRHSDINIYELDSQFDSTLLYEYGNLDLLDCEKRLLIFNFERINKKIC